MLGAVGGCEGRAAEAAEGGWVWLGGGEGEGVEGGYCLGVWEGSVCCFVGRGIEWVVWSGLIDGDWEE